MKRMPIALALAPALVAIALGGCQQKQNEPARAADDSAAPAAAPNVIVNPPPVNVTNPPAVNIGVPDVNVTVPDVKVKTPDANKSTKSTTVTIPGVGSTTTTTTKP